MFRLLGFKVWGLGFWAWGLVGFSRVLGLGFEYIIAWNASGR